MAVIEDGGSTPGLAGVDANSHLEVNLPTVAAEAGYASMQVVQDDGTLSGTTVVRSPTIGPSRRLAGGLDTILFDDSFAATAQNTAIWKSAVTTFTLGLTSGYVVFNSGAVTTSGASQLYQTWKTFSLEADSPLTCEVRAMITAAPPSNWTANFGLALAPVGSAPYTPTDGVYFRINSTGVFGCVNYNGTETVSGLLYAAGSITPNDNFGYRIIVSHNVAEFWMCATNNLWQKIGELATPTGNGQPFSSGAVPITLQLNQPATASAAVSIKFSDVTVVARDTQTGRPFAHTQCGMGLSAYQGQNGATMGTTALYSNSLAAAAGTAMTNTAVGPGTGLGGQFSVLPTLAAGTDGILTSYQNPVGTATQPGRTLYVTGIRIQGVVTTALTGGPVYYLYSAAFGGTAVSLATSEAIAAKAPRRIALGLETYVVTAAVGAVSATPPVVMQFISPIVVNQGEYFQIVAKNIGTVTSAGAILVMVTVDGYFE